MPPTRNFWQYLYSTVNLTVKLHRVHAQTAPSRVVPGASACTRPWGWECPSWCPDFGVTNCAPHTPNPSPVSAPRGLRPLRIASQGTRTDSTGSCGAWTVCMHEALGVGMPELVP